MAENHEQPRSGRQRKDGTTPLPARPQPKAFEGEPIEAEETVGSGSATGFVGMLARRQRETGERFTPEQKGALRAKYQLQMAREVHLKKSEKNGSKKPGKSSPIGKDAGDPGPGPVNPSGETFRRRNWFVWAAAFICFAFSAAVLAWSVAHGRPQASPMVWLGALAIAIGAGILWWARSLRRLNK